MGRTLYIKSLKQLVVISFFISWISLFQYQTDIYKARRPDIEPTILSAGVVKLADLGLHSAASSYMWLSEVQSATSYGNKIPEYTDVITALDPKFGYPYAFAVLILPDFKMFNQAIEIGKKGLVQADPDWRIADYMATVYHIFLKDRKNAAFYFDMAAHTPGAPEKIKQISANYGASADLRSQSREIWTSIYENSNDEVVQRRAKAYVTHYEVLDFMDEAVKRYKARYRVYPDSIEDLVTKKIIKAVPPDPFGLKYVIDKTTGKIMDTAEN